MWNIISDRGLNIADVDIVVERAQTAQITVCVDIESWLQFSVLLAQIEDLPGTIRVRRQPLPVEAAERYGEGVPA